MVDQVPQRGLGRVRALPWLVRGAPWWLLICLGGLLTAGGTFLITRPFSALGVLGLYVGVSCILSGFADLADRADGSAAGRTSRLPSVFPMFSGWLWLLTGLMIVIWLGRDLDLFGPVVSILMIVSGLLAVGGLAVDRTLARVTSALFGLAEILFGLLGLVWPDATLVVLAVLFGGRTLVFGVTLVIRGIFRLLGSRQTSVDRQRRWPSVVRLVTACCVLVLAILTTWVSQGLRSGIPLDDPFYDTPSSLPGEAGVLIKWDEYQGDLPAGLVGYRVYYTTTDSAGQIIPSSGIVALPPGPGPFPLITWAHGTVGVARACAPTNGRTALKVNVEPAVGQLASLGWAMVATDYPGMGADGKFPYLIGEGQGRAVLDAARAARQLPAATLSSQTVIWGHSQGGHAALWAAQLAKDYAPDLDIVGTAAISPASNPRGMAESVLAHPDAFGASLGIAFVADAYTKYYGLNLRDLVPSGAITLIREAASRCVTDGGTLVTILTGLSVARDQPMVLPDALDGHFGDLLDQNIPHGPWSAPLFIGQGENDEVIPFQLNQDYVGQLCSAGVDVEFHGYPGGTHMSVVADGSELSSDVVAWTKARLAGVVATPNC